MIQITDIKRQNREALKYIIGFYDLQRQYTSQLNNISMIGAANSDGMPHGTTVGNPCMNKAFSLIELENKKNWILSIEMAEQTLSEKTRKFLELRRDAENQIQLTTHKDSGRPSWVPYVQSHYAEWFHNRYGRDSVPSRQYMNMMMQGMVDATVRIAIFNKCF
jgi:hypothetical protein